MELRQVLREKGLSQVNTGGKGLGRIRLKCVHHLCGGKILTFSKEFYSLGKKRFEGFQWDCHVGISEKKTSFVSIGTIIEQAFDDHERTWSLTFYVNHWHCKEGITLRTKLTRKKYGSYATIVLLSNSFFFMALKVGVRLKWVANGAQCAYVRVDFKVKTSILSLFLGWFSDS